MTKILNSNLICIFENLQDFFKTFSFFSFLQDFAGLEIFLFNFQGFPGCVGILMNISCLGVKH